ncbi:glycoside hydrolase family protein [Echinicola sp. CAU 1574]|uniref:Glycoside hydrolase family protein n=1 Tax=Echinicola arenosa TaxID=2774144 RepID=A0ABR9AL06_9BACT|nr:glycoside hydrolase family protein [Echinicola arenosa]MBD8489493.1 glycoside hydrolase family protein [Echinicola arenosa]
MILKEGRVFLSNYKNGLATFIVLLLGFIPVIAQNIHEDFMFRDKIQPVDESNIFRSEDFFNWGGSIIKGDDNQYHLFYSRWPRDTKFTGWLLYSEVAHAVSASPSGPWTYKETVLNGRGKGHWDAITAHNPKIKYFEGKYYLYYISTNLGNNIAYSGEELLETSLTGYTHPNWKILRPNQRTGVAVANSLSGPWERMDTPLIEPSGPITTLTVNPAIDRGKDGKYYLIVKGDKPNDTNFTRNQALAIGNHPAGPFVIQDQPVIDYLDTEDMSLWYDDLRGKYFGIFHAHTFIGLVSSEDGIHWNKNDEFEIMPKEIPMKKGEKLNPDRMERPNVYRENGDIQVLLLACKKGNDSFIVTIPIKPSK